MRHKLPSPARAIACLIGLLSLCIWTILAIWNGHFPWRKVRGSESIAKAQHDLWSLSNDDDDNKLQHTFLLIREGLRLHYLSPPASSGQTKERKKAKLVIFIHGFPDSCHIFADFLFPPISSHANLVSLDLPGFGGSDELPNYGADEVLNTIASAIGTLKKRHLCLGENGERGQCILVGHDWGSAIASRLAMETQGLVDYLVLINGVVPQLFSKNVRRGIEGCLSCLRKWRRKKSNVQALFDAREAIRPVLAQLLKSNYIFMFTLPGFDTRKFGYVMDYLISVCYRAVRKDKTEAWEGLSWASSIGPGVTECGVSARDDAYGSSVVERALQHPAGDWDLRLRLYREDLFAGNWTLRGAGDTDEVKQVHDAEGRTGNTFQCPATILFGLKDFALDCRICAKGVEDFFLRGKGKRSLKSHVVLMDDCGHWSPLEKTGAQVLSDMLLEIIGVVPEGWKDMADRTMIRRTDFG